jgi:NADH-quinone oxidoreductase subunit L
MALTGIGLATIHKNRNNRPQDLTSAFGSLYRAAYRNFISMNCIFYCRKIIFNGMGRPAAWFDKNIVDGFMNGLATTTGKISGINQRITPGKVQNYALYFGGIIGLAVLFIYL